MNRLADAVLDAARRNPTTTVVVSACGGLALVNVFSVSFQVGVAAACFLTITLWSLQAPRLAVVAAVAVLAGLTAGSWREGRLDHSVLASKLGRPAPARVTVTGTARRSTFSVRVEATAVRYDGAALEDRVLLQLPAGRSPPRGSILELARAWPVEPRGPETGFDERAWLARKGIQVVLRAREWRVVGRRGGIGGAADRLRGRISGALARGAAGERLALLRGIVLGDDDALSAPSRDAFRASGLAHLTAVSGQNVAIIATGIILLARAAMIGRVAAQPLVAAAVLAYALAVGWQPSVVRATVAGLLVCLAWGLGAARQAWHFMALGGLALLAWNPRSALDPGFQLSFAAVAAILVLARRFETRFQGYPLPAKVGGGLAVAAACGIVTAPIVWLHFGAVPTWTVPANVAAEPAMPLVLALGLLAAASDPVSPEIAASLSWVAGWCAWWIAECARVFSSLPYAQIHSGPALAAAALLAVGAVWFRRLPRWRRRTLTPALLSAVMLLPLVVLLLRDDTTRSPPVGLRVTFLDVGQGDGTLLEVPEGAVLVDQGPPEARVAAQLRRLGVRRLSAVVLTHPQRDHIGGAADVLRRFPVDTVLDPAIPVESPDQQAALAAAREREVPVRVVRAGDRFRIGGLRLRVLWPARDPPPGRDPNEWAVVLQASYGRFDLLLTADAESNVTSRLITRPVEALKVAHHGSSDPGLERQLTLLRPRVAVISVGSGNDYGHPTAETTTALRASPALRLYRTDQDGQVTIETEDGRALAVTSQR
ncbi:MAG: ComEC/Rec2 family competence protein [Gaiella sp.]